MAWGVNDVDSVLFVLELPEARRSSGSNRDATLLLLLHPVHGSSTVVYLTDFVRDAGVIKDTLGRSSLTRINVSHDADVPSVIEVSFSHDCKAYSNRLLETEVREGFVRFSHAVRILLLLEGCALLFGCCHDLCRQAVGH